MLSNGSMQRVYPTFTRDQLNPTHTSAPPPSPQPKNSPPQPRHWAAALPAPTDTDDYEATAAAAGQAVIQQQQQLQQLQRRALIAMAEQALLKDGAEPLAALAGTYVYIICVCCMYGFGSRPG